MRTVWEGYAMGRSWWQVGGGWFPGAVRHDFVLPERKNKKNLAMSRFSCIFAQLSRQNIY
jgi:hypothetical protein